MTSFYFTEMGLGCPAMELRIGTRMTRMKTTLIFADFF